VFLSFFSHFKSDVSNIPVVDFDGSGHLPEKIVSFLFPENVFVLWVRIRVRVKIKVGL